MRRRPATGSRTRTIVSEPVTPGQISDPMTSRPKHEDAEQPDPDGAGHLFDVGGASILGAMGGTAAIVDPDSDPADDCTEMVARLYFFLDGELTDDRRSRIQAHLDRCPTCFGAFDFEAELRMVVASRLRSHVPHDLAERIRSSLGEAGDDGPDGVEPGSMA